MSDLVSSAVSVANRLAKSFSKPLTKELTLQVACTAGLKHKFVSGWGGCMYALWVACRESILQRSVSFGCYYGRLFQETKTSRSRELELIR